MDQFYTSLMNLWISFMSTPTSSSCQPQLEVQDEYLDNVDGKEFSDSVANGNGPICYVEPNGPYSWGQQVERPSYFCEQTDDGPMDQNSSEKKFYELTSDHHSIVIPQMDPGSWIAQEIIALTTNQSPCTNEQQIEHNLPQSPPFILESNMDVQIIPATIEQQFPKPIECDSEEPKPELSKRLSRLKLPLKERNILFETDSPKFICSSCGCTFKRQWSLTKHNKAYHAAYNHRCQICGKGFQLWEDLENHKLRHNPKIRRIACEHCPETFSYRHGMIRHAKAIHAEKMFKCQCCEERFVWPGDIKAHKKKLHQQKNDKASKENKRKSTWNKGMQKK